MTIDGGETGLELLSQKPPNATINDIEIGSPNRPLSSNEQRNIQLYVLINVASSITLTFINRTVFRYAVWAHIQLTFIVFEFAITGLGLYICSRPRVGLFTAKFVNPLKVAPLSLSAVAVVVLNNLSLSYNSVAFCQMAAVLTTPVVVVINLLVYREPLASKAATALGVVCFGVALASYGEIVTSLLGVLFAVAGLVVMAIYQVWIGIKHVELDLNPAQLLLNHAPMTAGMLLIFVPFTDTLPHFLDIGFNAWFFVLLSSIISLLVNLSQFWIIESTGPVTYNVVGHMETCIMVIMGWLVASVPVRLSDVFGVIIAAAGAFVYSLISASQLVISKRRVFHLKVVVTTIVALTLMSQFIGINKNAIQIRDGWGLGTLFLGDKERSNYHPIEILTKAQRERFDAFTTGQSSTFSNAVSTYRVKYKRHPPPGFYDWYVYARKQNSQVIDDFDSIYRDLEPFWGIPPDQIRQSLQSLRDHIPYLLHVSIRDGVPDQKTLESDGAYEKMIKKFAHNLPDMDLSINLLDEPRVVVGWDELATCKANLAYPNLQPGLDDLAPTFHNEWSPVDLNASYDPLPQLKVHDLAKKPTVSLLWQSCSPSSRAAESTGGSRLHGRRSDIPVYFVNDTEEQKNYCDFPEMKNMHGIFISPASFHVVNQLVPIFSQAKLQHMSDILIPSHYYYYKESRPLPPDERPYEYKRADLIWRGSTTGGHATNDRWRGMHRQRFIELTNNRHNPTLTADIMVRNTKSRGYVQAPYYTAELNANMFDTGFTSFMQCEVDECTHQQAFYGKKDSISEKEMFQSKYLVDLDGNSFSQRFFDFMRSDSLPIKSTIWSEWFDQRLFPWVHYVPLSLKYQEIYSLLLYYGGSRKFQSANRGDEYLPAHEEEAELIADSGRSWANRAIRVSDMDVYTYRLLLEYGRVLRDDRDTLGYDGDGKDHLEP